MSQRAVTPSAAPGVPAAGDTPDEVEYVLPASSAQQRLWFIDGLQPGNPAYNIPAVFELHGALDVDALALSVADLIARHEALRTTFREAADGLRQVIATRSVSAPLTIVDLTDVPVTERAGRAGEIGRDFVRRRFDLARGPLVDVALLQWSAADHTLLLNVHHAIADGWSMGVLCRDLSELYKARASGRESTLPPLALHYGDFAIWQRGRLEAGAHEPQAAYWQRTLAGAPAAINLPTDRPRPALKSYEGGAEWFELSAGQIATMKAFARGQQVTPFVVLLAACSVLLGRYSRQEDVLIGTPVADRSRPETESLVGFLINTVVLRADVSGNPTVGELLGRLSQVTAEATANHELPFDKLVEVLRPKRDLSSTPVFQVMVAYQPDPLETLNLPAIAATSLPTHNGTAKFDLLFGFEETTRGLRGMVEYSTDLFDAPTMRRLVGHLRVLLDAIVAGPEQRVGDLPMITPAERRQVLIDWNASDSTPPGDRCIHELFQAQAARTPDAIALVCDDQTLSYGELRARAGRLAAHLRVVGVASGSLVGVCLERSPDLIVALLAVLEAGGAYVPLDPAYPQERLRFILEDTAAAVLLTSTRLRGALPAHDARLIFVDEIDLAATMAPATDSGATVDDLAYVIYTSGSTGRPKGVALQHRAAVAMLYWARDFYGDEELAGVLASTSICFDLSVFEIFVPLSWGGTVILAENALQLPFLPAAGDVTLINTVPSAMAELLRMGGLPRGLRVANLAGERLRPALVDEIYRRTAISRVVDIYGPSETSYTTGAVRTPGAKETIGRPLAGVSTYVLDSRLNPVPIGVPGELYIGGVTMARGYLNRPELTAQRFVANPFGPTGSRLYASGDVARWLPDGNLEFLGRSDQQVKLRGFRIELGEIEATLRQNPHVSDAVVTVREDIPDDQRLAAYLVTAVPESEGPRDLAADLRGWLQSRLPDYMIPTAFVVLPAFPLTLNGKVDRRELPAPVPAPAAGIMAPRTDTERKLAEIWASLLQIEPPFGVERSFFDLGGNSLLAVRLFMRIQEEFGVSLPLASLFRGPTVAQLAAVIDDRRSAPAFSPLVAIQPNGTKPPFFAVHGVGGNVLTYVTLAKYLGADQPFYGLQARGLDGKTPPHFRVEDMAFDYVQEIRRVQPVGPYHVGGFSFGCSVALEIAQQLRRAGDEVALLGLIDGGLWRSIELLPFVPRLHRLARFHVSRLRVHIAELRRLRLGTVAVFARRKETTLKRRMKSIVWRFSYRRYKGSGVELPAHLRRVDEAGYMAFRQYLPDFYDGSAVLFESSESANRIDSDGGWGIVIRGGLETRSVPGNHVTLAQEPNVRTLAAELSQALARAHDAARRTNQPSLDTGRAAPRPPGAIES